jgi:hypothetical protein
LDTVEYFMVAEKGSAAWGKAIATIDTSADRVFAFLWFLMSNERNLEHLSWAGDLLKMELDVPNSRSKFQIAALKLPGGISNRIYANWWAWRKEEDGTFIAALAPHDGERSQRNVTCQARAAHARQAPNPE